MPRAMLPLVVPVYAVVCLPPLGLFASLHLPYFFRETAFGLIILDVIQAHTLDSQRGFHVLARMVDWRLSPCSALAPVLLALRGTPQTNSDDAAVRA